MMDLIYFILFINIDIIVIINIYKVNLIDINIFIGN